MSETGQKIVVGCVCLVIFVVSLMLVIIGQRNIGPTGLGTMMLGLVGLIGLLWYYNRKYR